MAYGMNGGSIANGMMPARNFGGYPDPGMYGQPQPIYYNNTKPQIYTVRYSCVLAHLELG